MADTLKFTLDEESEKRLYELLNDIDVRNTNRFWITDKRGYRAEYVKVVRCKDCRAFDEKRVLCKKNNMIAVREDDWCSRAERKEE